jgi:predicted hydrocarbon binding protein
MQSNPAATHNIIQTVERLQASLAMEGWMRRSRWLEILKLTPKGYEAFRSGVQPLSEASLLSLSKFVGVSVEDISSGNIDFRAVAVNQGAGARELPELYAKAAFSRRRAVITSFDGLEQILGWRARHDALRYLGVNEAVLSDSMAPINAQFFTDAAKYLNAKHGLTEQHIFEMGLYSSEANRKNLIGAVLSSAADVREAYLIFFEELLAFFEHHTKYLVTFMSEHSCTVEAHQVPYTAEAMGVRYHGSKQLCIFRAAVLASIPRHLDKPIANIEETSCVHRGDRICCYSIRFPASEPVA